MKPTLLFKKSSFLLFFTLLTALSAFSQSPPHIIASSNITTVSFCKNEDFSITVSYNFYNSGGTTATAPFRHSNDSGNLGMDTSDYSEGSNYQIPPGGTLSYSRLFSINPEFSGIYPDTDYTQAFYMTCAEPGATYETATIHLLSLSAITPQAATGAVTNITATSATLNGNIVNLGQCPQATQAGFYFRNTNSEAAGNIIQTAPVNATGPYSYNWAGLLPETTYEIKTVTVSGNGNVFGDPVYFTTAPAAANDNCANATPLSVAAPPAHESLANATDGDIFYSFTPSITGSYYVTIDNFGTPGNKNLAILNGCNGTVLGSGTSASLSTETASASLVAGTTYYIRVIDTDLHRDTFDIRIDPPHPVLSTSTSSLTIDDYYNDTFSASKSFTLSGIDLDGAPGLIAVTSTDPSFELSLDNTTWNNTVNVSYNGINLANTTIYVRMPAQSLGNKTGTISFSGAGTVATPVVSVTGTATLRPPTVFTNGTTALHFGNVVYPATAATQSFVLSGIRLVNFPAAINVLPSDISFQVSLDNVNWAIMVSVPYTTETLPATTVYVRFNPQAIGTSASGVISFFATGLADAPTVAINGTSSLAVPAGLSATPANTTFVASWDAVPGATSYFLDVDGSAAFNSTATTQTLAAWSLASNINISGGIPANTATTNPLTVFGTNPTISVNTNGAFASSWAGGNGTKYWQVLLSTLGYSQIKISSSQRSIVTGPRDFKLQYKIAATGTWNDVPGGTIIAATNTTSGVLSNLSLPIQCNNQPSVYLRWILTSDVAVNGSAIASAATSFIKSISINGINANYVPTFRNYAVNGTQQLVTGLTPAKTYYYRVRGRVASYNSANSATVNTTTGSTTIWDGTQWTSEAPDARMNASITGPYNTGTNGTFTANDVTVDTGGSVTVSNGSNISIGGNLSNTLAATAFVVENNANLIQTGALNGNTGAITVSRTASMNRLDYTYWSSPVANQDLFGFSSATLTTRFYEAKESDDSFIAPQSTTFVAAKGYCIRAPNNFIERPALPQEFTGSFTGVPNNGTITIPVTKTGLGFNLIGNPYPSTISTSAFFSANATIGTLYFWTHKVLGVTGDNAANYTSVNRTGATVAPGTPTPNGTIQTGQGFMVNTSAAGTVTFLNTMRVTNNAGQFYRNAASEEISDASRIWLNIADSNHTIGQILTGYVADATNDFDFNFDGKSIESTNTQLYNLVNGAAYVIQGRALPFAVTDTVPLGFKTATAGNFTLSIDHVDGLFAADQDIFLEDALAGTTTNLKAGPYTFASGTGTFDNRFKIVYQNSTLGIDTPTAPSSIVIYKSNNALVVNSGVDEMQQVKVYDIRGRLLFEDDKVNGTAMTVKDLGIANGVVIVKVQTVKGTFTKKVLL